MNTDSSFNFFRAVRVFDHRKKHEFMNVDMNRVFKELLSVSQTN